MKQFFKRFKRQIFALVLVCMIAFATCISISADDIYDDYQSVIITMYSSMIYGDSDSDSSSFEYSYSVGSASSAYSFYQYDTDEPPLGFCFDVECEDFSSLYSYCRMTHSYDDSSYISYHDAIGTVNIGGFYVSLNNSSVPLNTYLTYGGSSNNYGEVSVDITYRILGDFEEKHFQTSSSSSGEFVLEELIEHDLVFNYDIHSDFVYVSSVVINYCLPHEVENLYYALDDVVNFEYDITFYNLPTQDEMIERDADAYLHNHSQDKTVLDAVLDVFSSVGTWIANSVHNLIFMFYAEGDLTFLGVLAVAGLAISVVFLLFSVLTNFLRFRG